MKIFIFNFPQTRAGGIESLYQFSHNINVAGYESYMYFVTPAADPIYPAYRDYNAKIANSLEDSEENVFVYPEVLTDSINTSLKAKQALWWLSVDNNQGRFKDFNNDKIIHLAQSHYAWDYITKNQVKQKWMITDYIANCNYDGSPKENIVCYNPDPSKDANFTNAIIKTCPDIKFVPLTNMSKQQIINTLSRSKIYIDFGKHPGRDRIPREAALCKNIIITSQRGSANFDGDVPIPQMYKISSLNNINVLLKECLTQYDSKIKDFAHYQDSIFSQKQNSMKETLLFLNHLTNK